MGGNLRAIGVKPDGSQWSGGVENPWNASEFYTSDSSYVAAVNMSDMALVTSGDTSGITSWTACATTI